MQSDGGNGRTHAGSFAPASSSGLKEPERHFDPNEARELHFNVLDPRIRGYFEKPVIQITFEHGDFFHTLGSANGHSVQIPDGVMDKELTLNQPCIIRLDDREVLAIYRGNGQLTHVSRPAVRTDSGKISPRNDEQAFALNLLNDPRIKCLLLVGPAGTGKSLMVLDHIATHHERYESIILVKQPCSIGVKEGFLPGTAEEKFNPYAQSFFDNLKLLTDNNHDLFGMIINPTGDRGRLTAKIMMCSLGQFRGRKFPRSLIVLDEMQNTTYEEAYAVATRATGEDSRFVGLGDPDQVDYDHSKKRSRNGLLAFLEDTAGEEGCARVGLLKNEQSKLCAMLTRKLAARHKMLSV